MYICLNGGTAGGGSSPEQFTAFAASAGFQGADVDVVYGAKHGAEKLRELYESRKLRYGGWGVGDWRADETKWRAVLDQLRANAEVAARLGIDSCATWIMPSSNLPFM